MTQPILAAEQPALPRADHVVADQSAVFAFLANPASHKGGAPVTRIDTHGAAVFLVGQDAYKVKRAVAFPFMDFSTLEKRRIACQEEIAVNRPNAPDLYLEALPVVRGDGGLHLGGTGEVLDWVVHMRRFDETQTLDRVAMTEGLSPALLADLACVIATAHARAPRCAPDFDPVAELADVLADNADAFAAAPEIFPASEASALAEAARAALVRCTPVLQERAAAGYVRRCHGDLHLRNIARIGGHPVLFDAIEFNPALATCDVLYDLAFLLMDLCERDFRAQANIVLNRYLWAADLDTHYSGLAALPLFLSTRAAIRAKVGAPAAAGLSGAAKASAIDDARAYFRAASSFLHDGPPHLVAVGGLSGTGKTTLAFGLAPELGPQPGAVVLRSDIERKALAGVAETERLPPSAYTAAATQAVYDRLRHRASLALAAGRSVIVDAVHARADERIAIADVAKRAGISFTGLWLEAPVDTLRDRVSRRHGDASDADAAVVAQQARYDLGPITWRTIDVSGGATAGLRDARLAVANGPTL
ncbi:AAA family ATPase [Azorhizobium sp. AG788]|uniref:bifunctional aminoglycoside phosphotransferase/ATP-binding protein n=1 Tax=Azorhizobium sp. AG788 TaxID=2183897 RepID=UPI003138F0C8